ncbi:T9SS type A sorting domain-containing protein [Cryomorpha ignava]|uniref:T9SS type A sorting domain-containing protein n=1 Tax=Cryomorpha ignava TaxID=101383 RepID=A0A7K3WS67_9FLAO|nr:T9SS type A sorting domain-containing protein [Cryomorpha ignava]NEN24517.1 T9SS type A sorting domain-containing protein [Cryomorpha ignava]
MKAVFLLALFTLTFTFQSLSQNINKSSTSRDNDVLWSEDFSNGFDGTDGSWTFGLIHGELWFKTAAGQYNSSAPLPNASPLYGQHIPLFFENTALISSPTRFNGIAMLDADRFNSTATPTFPEGTATTNPIFSILESPPINLTGNPFSTLTFYTFSKICCSNFSGFVKVEFSTNGGNSWTDLGFESQLEFPLEEPNDQSMTFNLSSLLAGVSDISDCRIRYRWNGGNSHFFWMLDDIKIEALPENDLVAGKTFYNEYFTKISDFETNQISPLAYYRSLEYEGQPDYFASKLNFAAEVTNAGSTTQNNVILTVSVIIPGGDIPETFSSQPINLAPGVTDTIQLDEIAFNEIASPILPGEYVFYYILSQDNEDAIPEDNLGETRSVFITDDFNLPGAVIQNGREVYESTLTDVAEDVILGTVYAFPEPTGPDEYKIITGIETVFLYDQEVAETEVNQLVYFNLRSGSVLKETNNPSTFTSVFYDSEEPVFYDDTSLEHIITQDNLWNPDDGNEFNWTSFEFPYPILVNPSDIYQAEMRVPVAPVGIVYQPVGVTEEPYGSVRYDFNIGNWEALGDTANGVGIILPIRLITQTAVGLEKVSSKNGLELVQNYPNPFHDETTIQFRTNKTSQIELQVRDLTGKLVFSRNMGITSAGIPRTYNFQRGDLAAGIYTYTVISDEFQLSRKLTVE